MSQFVFDSDEMSGIHVRIKRAAQAVSKLSSELSNNEEMLSLYESDAIDKQRTVMRKANSELEEIAENLVYILDFINEMCENVYYTEQQAYNRIAGSSGKYDNSKYKSLNSDLGNCTIVQNYAYVNEMLITQLKTTLAGMEDRLSEIAAMKKYSDMYENDVSHHVGSYASRELAALSEELSYYVSAIAATSALASWYGQGGESGNFSYTGEDFNFTYTFTKNATGISWVKNLSINGYGLTTRYGTSLNTDAGLGQLESEWQALAACHANAKDASSYAGFRGNWTATSDSVTFDNEIDQYMYEHWYKKNPFFSFRQIFDYNKSA